MESLRLTQFSPGAGCGCKIAPRELEVILQGSREINLDISLFPSLLVGNETKDDAAVYDIGGGQALISTTDFFTPIVDNPFDFGRIAATNAISDIYAMGGTPLMAIAILGWPLDKLPAALASQVVAGARSICTVAGIPLAGGHSINISDPVFGLAVTGIIEVSRVKRNNSVQKGDLLFLTKPLGIGLISTGIKFGMATEAMQQQALAQMTTLNKVGTSLAALDSVHALTDVTGFGLMGHCLEMVDGSDCTAHIDIESLPRIPGIETLIDRECLPGGTFRNWASYGHRIKIDGHKALIDGRPPHAQTAPAWETLDVPTQKLLSLLCDPQTSGGLLIAAAPQARESIEALCPGLWEIGRL